LLLLCFFRSWARAFLVYRGARSLLSLSLPLSLAHAHPPPRRPPPKNPPEKKKKKALLPEAGAKNDADTYEYEITSDQSGDQVAANAAKTGSSQFTPDGAFAGRQTDGKVLSGAKDPLTGEDAYTYEYEVDVPSGSENLSDEEILALVKKQREEKEGKGQETREQQLAREQRDRESRAAQQKREEEDRLRGEGKLPPAGASDTAKTTVDVDVKPSTTVGGRGGEGEPVVEESKTALPPVEAVKPSDLAKRSVSAAQPAPAASQGLSGGAKAGIAFGVLAAIALIAGGTYYAAKHKGLIGGGAAAGGSAGGAKRAARVSGSGSRWSRGGAPA
jgi:hypothetical protein